MCGTDVLIINVNFKKNAFFEGEGLALPSIRGPL